MTVNEAIEALTEARNRGYGDLEIQTYSREINGVDTILCLDGFFESPKGDVVIMDLDEKCIY